MTVEIKVVEQDGTVLATLTDMVQVDPLRDVLNRAGSFSFALHNLDPLADEVRAIEREVQVWRNGSLMADGGWLVPITPEAQIDGATDTVSFECRGLGWFFDRRFMGDADRRNYIDDGGFETSGLPDWTAVLTTLTRDNVRRLNGTYSAKLVTAAAGTDSYASQTVSITAGGVGALMTVAGWFRVDSSGFLGEAFGGRGIFIQRSVGGTLLDFDFDEMPNDGDEVPLDSWQRREATVTIPPNATEDIEVRIYGAGGTTRWDEVVLVAMDSVSFYETDQATIADGIVAHLQDPAYGKSDLLIGRDCDATGVLRDRHYQHAEHQNGATALHEFTTLDDGFDASIVLTSTTRTYTTHYPRKGTSRTALATSEIVRLRWVPVEGEQACSSVTTLGDGDGPDREEGAALDPTAYGGVTLEEVLAAPVGTPIDGLDEKAAEELRIRKTAAHLEVTLGPGLRIGTLLVGDTLDITVSHGYVDVSGDWRVHETAWDPVTDCLTFVAGVA